MKPKISIIVAVYNVEKYLRECLDSLINQTLKDIEIICVNDGSTDNSWEILQEYARKDKRLKVITQANRGTGGGRNTALSLASGEFICITDSDDYRAFDCLEKLYNAAIENDTDSAFGDVKIISVNGEFYKDFIDSRPYNKVLDIKTNLKHSIFQCQAIYRREPIKDIRYVEGVDYEDGIFQYEIDITLKSTIHVKDAIYYYRQVPSSSCRGTTDKIFKVPYVIEYFQNLFPKYESNENFNYFKTAYKEYIAFLLKKCFFKRIPPNTPHNKVIQLYFELYKYMNLRQKIRYGRKVLFYPFRKCK